MFDDIKVSVETEFLPEESKFHNENVWTYFITITNNSETNIQLLKRHWLITDGDNKSNEVIGDGVVGLQPIINAGSSFNYNSFYTSKTNNGIMSGTYLMQNEKNEKFNIIIPPFYLTTND